MKGSHYYCTKIHWFLCFKLFIENVDENTEKNPKNLYAETPLHIAANNGHLDVYQYLIRNVEDKNPKNREGLTPLQYAGMKNYHCFENFLSEYLQEVAENEKLKKEFPWEWLFILFCNLNQNLPQNCVHVLIIYFIFSPL